MPIEQTRMEREHVWRDILQEQFGRHWLSLYYPDAPEKPAPVVLPKIRGGEESEVSLNEA